MDAMTYDRSEISRNALAQAAAAEGKRLRRIDDALDASRRWHLVTIPQPSFTLAKQQLEDKGYTLYAPLVRDMVMPKTRSLSLANRKNRKLFAKERLSPFFGSYRFVRFDMHNDPWHDIFKLVGVYGIACVNDMPVAMPNTLIQSLKDKEINGAIPGSTPVKALDFSIGDGARINTGPFIGLEGTVSKVDERGRIELLLELFAGVSRVDLSADEVDKLRK
jgi:transcription antitermination factor NusG